MLVIAGSSSDMSYNIQIGLQRKSQQAQNAHVR